MLSVANLNVYYGDSHVIRDVSFDLAAGVMLVRNAGGRVVDLAGGDVDWSPHTGPFVAGVDEKARQSIVSMIESIPLQ